MVPLDAPARTRDSIIKGRSDVLSVNARTVDGSAHDVEVTLMLLARPVSDAKAWPRRMCRMLSGPPLLEVWASRSAGAGGIRVARAPERKMSPRSITLVVLTGDDLQLVDGKAGGVLGRVLGDAHRELTPLLADRRVR